MNIYRHFAILSFLIILLWSFPIIFRIAILFRLMMDPLLRHYMQEKCLVSKAHLKILEFGRKLKRFFTIEHFLTVSRSHSWNIICLLVIISNWSYINMILKAVSVTVALHPVGLDGWLHCTVVVAHIARETNFLERF